MVKKITMDEYDLHYIQTDKFTTSLFGILFLEPLAKEELAEKNVLARLMVKTTNKYKSENELSNFLKDQYDANLSSGINIFGKTVLLNVKASFINDEYVLKNENLFSNIVKIINDAIMKPGFLNDNLEVDASKLKREKDLYLDEIKSLYNNKVAFAINEMRKAMHKNEEYGIAFQNLEEKASNINEKSLLEAYQHLLKMKKIVFYIGNKTLEEVKKVVLANLQFKITNPNKELLFVDKLPLTNKNEEEIIVPTKITQSVLTIGLRSDIVMDDELFEAMNALTFMFGGYFNSTLFQVIREQHSLAYYVSSIYDSKNGDLIIYAGINKKNYQKTLHLIMDSLSRYQNGDFEEIDELNLQMAKLNFEKTLIESVDEMNGLLSKILDDVFGRKILSTKEAIEKINSVTLEEVKEAALHLKLDTIYLLQGDMDYE